MERIHSLNWYQKAVLILLLAMLIVFGIVYARTASQEGYEYKGEIFLPSYENGKTVYSCRLYDADCSFTVTEDKVVSFRCEDKYYGPYTAVEDASAIPADHTYAEFITGIEVRENGKLLFRGGVTGEGPDMMLFDENGELYGFDIVSTVSDGTQIDENGNAVDPWKPSVYTILELMGEPELTKKGEWAAWWLGVFLSVVTAVSVLFADELFRLGLMSRVRDWERAEPSGFEIAGRYISWTILPIMILWIYLIGLK